MTDWRMVVESFPNGKHNWPRLNGPPRAAAHRPAPVVTTMQYVRATRGEFVFDDHARALGRRRAATSRSPPASSPSIAAARSSHGGTIHFADFEPMSADMSHATSGCRAARSCSTTSI